MDIQILWSTTQSSESALEGFDTLEVKVLPLNSCLNAFMAPKVL